MIAENLQKLRKNLSLKQDEFALKLGISPRAYVNYERGERKPPYEMLIKLSDDFNVNLNWLINDKGDMYNAPKFEQAQGELALEIRKVLREEGLIK
jgi:transcriptional regulator with XRE-family HTH domain